MLGERVKQSWLSDKIGRHSVVKAHEVGARYRDCFAETAVVGSIFHFFGENIAAVDDTRNVGDEDFSIRLCFTDFIFLEVDVLGSFVGNR